MAVMPALPTHDAMVANVLDVHHRLVTDADRAAGLEWYSLARAIAERMSESTIDADLPLDFRACAGVIAALSPRMTWAQNIEAARAVVAAHVTGAEEPPAVGTTANRAKAWKIAHLGLNPVHVLGGDKVRAFWRNIVGDTSAVTVDVWATRVATAGACSAPATSYQYDAIATVYRVAAGWLDNTTPSALQAATWIAYRRVHGHNRKDPS